MKIVVCDDVVSALRPALERYFPEAKIQLCHNHYIENIRQLLSVRTRPEHQRFFAALYEHVFLHVKTKDDLKRAVRWMLSRLAPSDDFRQDLLMEIADRADELFAYRSVHRCPKDTNLIELYNSHLNARLRSIKGFKSFAAADRWLNAYLVRRRTKRFTDCDYKFRRLNGKSSLELTTKNGRIARHLLHQFSEKHRK